MGNSDQSRRVWAERRICPVMDRYPVAAPNIEKRTLGVPNYPLSSILATVGNPHLEWFQKKNPYLTIWSWEHLEWICVLPIWSWEHFQNRTLRGKGRSYLTIWSWEWNDSKTEPQGGKGTAPYLTIWYWDHLQWLCVLPKQYLNGGKDTHIL